MSVTRKKVLSALLNCATILLVLISLYEYYGLVRIQRCRDGFTFWAILGQFVAVPVMLAMLVLTVLPAQLIFWLYEPTYHVMRWHEMCDAGYTQSYLNYGCSDRFGDDYLERFPPFKNSSNQVILGNVAYDRQFECTHMINMAALAGLELLILGLMSYQLRTSLDDACEEREKIV